MQVDRIFSAVAAIIIKENIKTVRGISIQWKGDPQLSSNGAKTAP